VSRPRRPIEERFAKYLAKAGPDECWLWTGSTRRGYGSISFVGHHGGRISTHRFAFEQANGPIPDGLVVRHKCDVRLCCNPAHLELGTTADNNRDMLLRGRQARGSRHGNARLTEAQVADIRASLDAGEKQTVLADRYGVSQAHISLIHRGAAWRDAPTATKEKAV
jgi:hypothetical protein